MISDHRFQKQMCVLRISHPDHKTLQLIAKFGEALADHLLSLSNQCHILKKPVHPGSQVWHRRKGQSFFRSKQRRQRKIRGRDSTRTRVLRRSIRSIRHGSTQKEKPLL